MVNAITDTDFKEKTSKGFALIDFWAEWCGPCKQLMPIVEEVASELENKIAVFKMNIDDNPNTPTEFGIRSIPTLIIFKDGVPISTKVGSMPKSAMIEWINSEIA